MRKAKTAATAASQRTSVQGKGSLCSARSGEEQGRVRQSPMAARSWNSSARPAPTITSSLTKTTGTFAASTPYAVQSEPRSSTAPGSPISIARIAPSGIPTRSSSRRPAITSQSGHSASWKNSTIGSASSALAGTVSATHATTRQRTDRREGRTIAFTTTTTPAAWRPTCLSQGGTSESLTPGAASPVGPSANARPGPLS